MTLLELILALALSVVVMSAVSMAIQLYFKMLELRRTNVEEMQAVRVVVQRMTNDIRASVYPYEPDLAGLETTFQNATQALTAQASAAAGATTAITVGGGQQGGGQQGGGQQGGGQAAGGGQGGAGGGQGGAAGGGQAAGGQAGGAGGGQGQSGGGAQSGGAQGAGATGGAAGGATGGASGAASTATGTDATGASTTTSTATVKLTGTATEMRLDISRLPRMDQYQGILSKGELSADDLPSDVKTIVYFIRSDTSSKLYADDPYARGGEASTDGYGRGLMRAELDRAVNTYSETSGTTDAVYSSAQLLSEEVVGLGFEYFDGVDFLTEWDSSSQGLPRAIRIWLSVLPTYGMTDEELARASAGKEPQSTDFYFTISLPTTPLVIPAPAAETTDASAATTSTSTSSSTSTSTSTTSTGTMP
jgi:hypothetical protein